MKTIFASVMSIKDFASTQYDDFKGFSAIDFHGGTDYQQLCEDCNINIEDIFVIGIKFSEHSIQGVGQHGNLNVSIYGIATNLAGSTYDDVENYINSHTGTLQIIEKGGYVPLASIGKYIKRFEVTAFKEGLLDNLLTHPVTLDSSETDEDEADGY